MTKKSHAKKKKRALHRSIVAIVLLVIVIVGAAGWFLFTRKAETPKQTISREEELANITADADQKAAQQGVDKGAAEFDSAIEATNDAKEKSQFMASKATLYFNDGKLDQALVYALEADKLHGSSAVSALVAQIYEAQNNKPKAVEYYKKASGLIDPQQPMAENDREYYQAKIKELGG